MARNNHSAHWLCSFYFKLPHKQLWNKSLVGLWLNCSFCRYTVWQYNTEGSCCLWTCKKEKQIIFRWIFTSENIVLNIFFLFCSYILQNSYLLNLLTNLYNFLKIILCIHAASVTGTNCINPDTYNDLKSFVQLLDVIFSNLPISCYCNRMIMSWIPLFS